MKPKAQPKPKPSKKPLSEKDRKKSLLYWLMVKKANENTEEAPSALL
jgi:hypothetical protein